MLEPGKFGPQEAATFDGEQSNERTNRPGTSTYALKIESRTTLRLSVERSRNRVKKDPHVSGLNNEADGDNTDLHMTEKEK